MKEIKFIREYNEQVYAKYQIIQKKWTNSKKTQTTKIDIESMNRLITSEEI